MIEQLWLVVHFRAEKPPHEDIPTHQIISDFNVGVGLPPIEQQNALLLHVVPHPRINIPSPHRLLVHQPFPHCRQLKAPLEQKPGLHRSLYLHLHLLELPIRAQIVALEIFLLFLVGKRHTAHQKGVKSQLQVFAIWAHCLAPILPSTVVGDKTPILFLVVLPCFLTNLFLWLVLAFYTLELRFLFYRVQIFM